ncbi:hypothetical protein PIB30_036560 [Stylosanthes scabra]|uniref:Uncharacterized protein n=1 Tax=Stylosanthes scabra TaxID=79078 RepID=A0ABU6WDD3_9FABA|nr:hypothetical protein [Stylosanthes scabra]
MNANQNFIIKMGLQLIFLLIRPHLVLCIHSFIYVQVKLYPFICINKYAPFHDQKPLGVIITFAGVPSSIALLPSKASFGVDENIAVSLSHSFSNTPSKNWIHGYVNSPLSHHKHHNYKGKLRNQVPQLT